MGRFDQRQSQVRAGSGDSFQTTTKKINRPVWGIVFWPYVPREPIPELPRNTPLFNLDVFSLNVRFAEKGAAGPSGMACDHFRPFLDSNPDMHLLFVVGELFFRGQIPHDIVQLVKLGVMMALRKKDGVVRGIVAGEKVFRRPVARTIAQQFSSAATAATVPFQDVLSTRAGCECVSHALQNICELDENATVTSIDGASAYEFPGGPCCWGWNEFLEAEQHHHLCDCSTPNRQRTSGKMMTEWFTQFFMGKAVSRETPSCHSCSASASIQHWKRFNGGFVRVNDISRSWMTCVWCHSWTGHGTHTTWRSKRCGR